MPTSMTFTSLSEDVRSYLERGNVADTKVFAQIPRLINLAEREIAKDTKLQGFINVVTSDFVIGTSVYAKPDRWRETISMSFGKGTDNAERTSLFPRSYEYCRAYWPNPALRAEPEFYADYNYSNWLVVPTPIQTYPWELIYWELPALLDATNQTNWLTDYDPALLLNRTLHESFLFLKKYDDADKWFGKYQQSLGSVNTQDLEKVVDRTTTRQRP